MTFTTSATAISLRSIAPQWVKDKKAFLLAVKEAIRDNIIKCRKEGIVFSFCYGMEIMQQMGMDIKNIHAGKANMFLSPSYRY